MSEVVTAVRGLPFFLRVYVRGGGEGGERKAGRLPPTDYHHLRPASSVTSPSRPRHPSRPHDAPPPSRTRLAAGVIDGGGAEYGGDEEGGEAVLRRDAGRVPVPL